MQTRHNAFRTNAATVERVKNRPGEAFTRKEAYLSLLALVAGLVINTMPGDVELNDWMPNDEFGTVMTVIYLIGWWLMLLSAFDALFTTVSASIFLVVPSVVQTTLAFGLGIWLTFIFWTAMFCYDAYVDEVDYAARAGATRETHIVKAVFSLFFSNIGIPVLIAMRYAQYNQRFRPFRLFQRLVDFDNLALFQPE